MTLLLWIAGAIASAFVGLVISTLFQDRISLTLAKTLHFSMHRRGDRALPGDWYTYYEVYEDKKPPGVKEKSCSEPSIFGVEVIRLKRIGSGYIGSSALTNRIFVLNGTFEEGIFTGIWRNYTDRYDWGSFQLRWLPNGMVGKFLGRNSKNYVNHGIWLWSQTPDGLPEVLNKALVKDGYPIDKPNIGKRLDEALARTLKDIRIT